MPNLTVDEMLGLDRFLNAQVSSLDTTVADKSKKDLQALGGFIRRGISEALQKVDPQTAKDYAQLKKFYEEGIEGVLGTLNKGTIEAIPYWWAIFYSIKEC